MYLSLVTRYLRTELEKRDVEVRRLGEEKNALLKKRQENEAGLANCKQRLAKVNHKIHELTININELKEFEYPNEDEVVQMVRILTKHQFSRSSNSYNNKNVCILGERDRQTNRSHSKTDRGIGRRISDL